MLNSYGLLKRNQMKSQCLNDASLNLLVSRKLLLAGKFLHVLCKLIQPPLCFDENKMLIIMQGYLIVKSLAYSMWVQENLDSYESRPNY